MSLVLSVTLFLPGFVLIRPVVGFGYVGYFVLSEPFEANQRLSAN